MVALHERGRRGGLELVLVEVAAARDAVNVLMIVALLGRRRARRGKSLLFAFRELRLPLHRMPATLAGKGENPGNFSRRLPSNAAVRIVPARVRAFLDGAPLFFIGAVIAIAVVFRLGLGLVKTASAEPEAPFVSHLPIPVATTPSKPVEAAPAVDTMEPEPDVITATAPKAHKKPRTHGKR